VLDLGIEIADALEAAHAAGIIHREKKPRTVAEIGQKAGKVLGQYKNEFRRASNPPLSMARHISGKTLEDYSQTRAEAKRAKAEPADDGRFANRRVGRTTRAAARPSDRRAWRDGRGCSKQLRLRASAKSRRP
jgi:hypothetical protein